MSYENSMYIRMFLKIQTSKKLECKAHGMNAVQ